MPISIITLYALVISAFIADQLSSLVDAHWQIAEFSYRDPWHIGITIFWGAVIIWILSCIKRKQPSTPKTFLYLGIISAVFLLFEISVSTVSVSSIMSSFQALEGSIWLICYAMCKYNKTLVEWFSPTGEVNRLA